jgi:phosphoribosylformylglycinamidine cyclo-ligase
MAPMQPPVPPAAADGLTYADAGVDYDPLDRFKRLCQRAARGTVGALATQGLAEPPAVRGDSAYLVELADAYLAHVEEGLGTKHMVADAVQRATGVSHWRAIGIDLVATMVNDLVTCGALPTVIAMHAAVGDAAWFADEVRAADLADGFAEGCRRAGAVWGGGETPALKGVVADGEIVLAGSAVGFARPKSRRITGDIRPGDAIVLIASSGIHTNGLSLCRRIAAALPAGYATPIAPDGPDFGTALLAPSAIYVDVVRTAQAAGLAIGYAVHVTGHGWRKLMRADQPLVYRVDRPGTSPALFDFLMAAGPITPKEAWGTFNMGVGFALILRPDQAGRAVAIAEACGHRAWIGGEVVADGGRKAVEIPSLGLAWAGDALAVR